MAAAQAAPAATFVVNIADDSNDEICSAAPGDCSLREALNAANDAAGADTIGFAIGSGGPQTIAPTGPLPTINDQVTIDGTTQPGFDGVPVIVLDGSGVEAPAAIPGLFVTSGGGASAIRGLAINRFTGAGILIEGVDAVVQGSYLGTDRTGTAAQGNGVGLVVDARATIGGATADTRNVISGNLAGGVQLLGRAAGAQIRGNHIGTNSAGAAALPNQADGISIDGANGNVVGGFSSALGNVISGNGGVGIRVDGGNSNQVLANKIGAAADGTTALGNRDAGVLIEDGNDNAVGNVEAGPNTIIDNGRAGVWVVGGVRNRVTQNSIDANSGLGIDLGTSGVTPNDTNDPDAGANDLQNFPVITQAVTHDLDLITISGTLNTHSENLVRLEFFASEGCDPAEHGEGARFLGATNVDTGGGTVGFNVEFTRPVLPGEAITATASLGANTSEFSKCFLATGTVVDVFTVNTAADTSDGECDSAHCSLREAIANANALSGRQTIEFHIVPAGVHTIALGSPLPSVTDPVTIDGRTQPGFASSPAIELDGSATVEASGIDLAADDSTVRALVVNGFDFSGIIVRSDASGALLAGNYVGTDRTGTVARPNGRGITIQGSDNTVGGTAAADANVVSANGEQGVRLEGNDNRVLGNRIGTDPAGTLDLGNDLAGVRITGSGNSVGGTASGEGNTIAFNGTTATGVTVIGGTRNAILGNSIRSNAGLGIDLGDDGVTTNDPGDADAGANGLQNFPVLTSAERRGGNVAVTGGLESLGSTTYRVELFGDTACDPSGNGEGRVFMGSTTVTTTPAGDASFAATLPLPTGNTVVTATATDPAGSTSELSRCLDVEAESDVTPMRSAAECVPVEDGGRTITFEEPGEGPLAERYAALGIHFRDDETTTPILYSNVEERQTSSNPNSLSNDADDPNTSAGVPLTISFDEPQSAVGFFMGNGTTDGTPAATLTAYGAEGERLGAVIRAVPTNDVTTYFGVQRAAGGIHSVTLDYGATSLGEEIDDLCFTGPPLGEGGEGLTLTADAGANPAGSLTQIVPLASVPSNQLMAFSGAPSAAPVGSIPVGSIPVGSIPVGSIPVGSIPVGSIPVGSIPVGSIPVGSIPVGSIGLAAIPVGSIGLDQILLTSLPVDWSPILAGTPLAGVVLQTLTLADVYANATARQRFEALTLAQSGLHESLLGGVTLAALLLGNKTLSQIPPPGAATWCGAIANAGGSCSGVSNSNTVAGLSIAGAPVGSIPVGSIPVGSIAGGIAGTPVGSIPVGSIDIAATRLAAIELADIPNANAVVDCSRISCTGSQTLGDAAALTPSAIRPNATLALLQAVLGDITLNEIIIGILPRSALAWEQFPIDGLQLFTPNPDPIRYTAAFDLDCAQKAGLAVTVKLPAGDVVVQGSTRLRYGNAAEITGPNATTNATTGARWTNLPDPCPGDEESRHIELSFDALTGFDLGTGVASARVLAGGEVESVANQAPVLVHQNWESNDDPATAPTVQPDQLVIGHIARTGDQETFRVAIPAGLGVVTTFYLSHMGEDAGRPGKPADFDLVVSGPGVPPFQSSPVGSIPVGSIPIEDKGADVDDAGQPLPPETLQDIPVGSIPVGSISANRGGADEVAQVVSRGESGVYTIVVRGYNGSFSREPFVLRVKRTPAPPLPACPARTVGAPGAVPTLPVGVPSDRQTIFLVNQRRMGGLFGTTDTNAMLASLNVLAERPEVKGVVLPVDGNTAVRNAYTAWDASPCNVEAANDVVRRINDVVAGYRASLPNLRYVVMLGSDDALPMARVPDRVTISPEFDFAGDLQFTTQNLTRGNPIYAAAALSYFLTDGAYGAFTHYPWLGRELLLPQVPVTRLVESSAQIKEQIDQYVTSNGVLDPGSALTTGYDFLSDGAMATGAALATLVGAANATDLITDTWTRQDLVSRFTGATPPDDVNAVNAHFSQWQLQPASASAAADLVTTADIPAPGLDPAFKDRILFTVGCHGGYNVPNTLLSGPLPPQAADWAESWARQRAAVYVANTGFGYGDTHANALSERLMSIFAAKLNQAKPIGELWNDAQHEYYGGAGAYDVYDEKALVEATFFGLPFWTVAGATAPPSPTPPPVVTDPVTGLPVARLTVDPALHENVTADGRFWDLGGRIQATHYRPLQPRFEQNVTRPGAVAHGIIITSLETDDRENVDPVLAQPTVDLSGHEPERNFRDVVFPASLVNLTRSRGLRGDQQGFVVNAGQFRPLTPAGPLGIERLVESIGVEIAYSTSADVTPPSIRQVGSTFTGTAATIFVDVVDPPKRVAALFNDASSWRFAELANVAGTSLWTATVPTTHEIEVAAMAQDDAGNVGYSVNKGFNFLSIVDTLDPEILIDAPLAGGIYRLRQAVPASYHCSDVGGVQSCVGTVPNGANIDTSTPGRHTFSVTATDLGGRTTTKTVSYFVQYAFEGFFQPVDNPPKLNQGRAGRTFPVKWRLRDAAGNPIRDLSTVRSITSRQLACDDRPVDELEQSETSGTSTLTYSTSDEQFVYHWKTEKAWARTCRRLVVELTDDTKHFADFHLR